MAEGHRPLPAGWEDGPKKKWEPNRNQSYTGPAGGAPYGPTTQVQHHCSSLASLFLFFFPMMLLEIIAWETNQYGNGQWVKQCQPSDENDDSSAHDSEDSGSSSDEENNSHHSSKKKKKVHRPILVPCDQTDDGT